MASCIKVYKDIDMEHEKILKAAMKLTEYSPNRYKYYIGNVYFDFGAGLMWTTVLCDKGCGRGSYQALCPRDQKSIILAETDEQIEVIVREILADEYCPDKVKKGA